MLLGCKMFSVWRSFTQAAFWSWEWLCDEVSATTQCRWRKKLTIENSISGMWMGTVNLKRIVPSASPKASPLELRFKLFVTALQTPLESADAWSLSDSCQYLAEVQEYHVMRRCLGGTWLKCWRDRAEFERATIVQGNNAINALNILKWWHDSHEYDVTA